MSEGEQPMSKTVKGDRDKIGGYDAWRVKQAVTTLQEADEIRADDKFLAVVIKEMSRESDKLEESADLLKKVGGKLKAIREADKKKGKD